MFTNIFLKDFINLLFKREGKLYVYLAFMHDDPVCYPFYLLKTVIKKISPVSSEKSKQKSCVVA